MRFCLLLLALCLAAVACADDPRLYSVNPTVIQRGQPFAGFFSGDRLLDHQNVMLYDDARRADGLTVTSLTSRPVRDGEKTTPGGQPVMIPSPKVVDFAIDCPESCPLGKHRVRIATRTGQTELRNVLVVDVPVRQEGRDQPNRPDANNNSFETAAELPLDVAVQGKITNEDVDYYAVDCTEGERLTVEVHGTRLGNSTGDRYFDPYLAVLDADRFEVAACDDHPLTGNDPFVSLTVPKTGRYVILVRHSSYNGDASSTYVMHVGRMPRPIAAMPPGGRPGETLDVRFQLADSTAGRPVFVTQSVTLPTEDELRAATHPFGVWLRTGESDGTNARGVAPSPLPLRVADLPVVAEVEPNDHEQNQPTPVGVDVSAGQSVACHGVVDGHVNDEDNYRFDLKKGQAVQIQAFASTLGSPLDAVMNVYRLTPKFKHEKGSDDLGGSYDGRLDFTAPETGQYVVRMRDHRNRFGPDFTYRMEITPPARTMTLEPIEYQRYIQHKLTVPRGGGVGVNLAVTRQGFGGPVTIASTDLPPGVEVVSPRSFEEKGRLPLMIYAADDAPLGGRFARIEATHQPVRTIETTVAASSMDAAGNVTAATETKTKVEVAAGEPIVAPVTQKLLMVRWRNNNRVVEEPVDRLPIVVADPVPFGIALTPPAVPIVPGAALPLAVTGQRDKGYKNNIRVVLLENPPGVSSSQSAKLEHKPGPDGAFNPQSQTTITLTASDKAQPGTYDLAARAYVATRETLSRPVPVTIAPRWVDLEWTQAAAEQGASTAVIAQLAQNEPWTGTAVAELKGLPPHATAEPVTITPESTEIVWTVTVGEKTPPGTHKSLHATIGIPYGDAPNDPELREARPAELVQVSTTAGSAKADGAEADAKEKPKEKPKTDAAAESVRPEAPAAAEDAAPKDDRPLVMHLLKGGVLRVDKPLPKKPKADAKPVEKQNEKQKKPAGPKPLSRLEQLRQAKAAD